MYRIAFFSTAVRLLFTFLIFYPALSFSQSWNNQFTGQAHLFGVHFLDAQNGWAAGNRGYFLHTSNGGNDWNRQNTGFADWDYTSIRFADANHGMATINNLPSRFNLSITTNGGAMWSGQMIGLGYELNSLAFVDSNHAWIAGSEGIYCSTNSGLNWTVQVANDMFRKIVFVDTSYGWALNDLWDVYRTSNGGRNWSSQSLSPGNYLSIAFADTNNG